MFILLQMLRNSETFQSSDQDFGLQDTYATINDEVKDLDDQNNLFQDDNSSGQTPNGTKKKTNNKPKSEFFVLLLLLLDLISDSITATEITIMVTCINSNSCSAYCWIDCSGIYFLRHCFIIGQ